MITLVIFIKKFGGVVVIVVVIVMILCPASFDLLSYHLY